MPARPSKIGNSKIGSSKIGYAKLRGLARRITRLRLATAEAFLPELSVEDAGRQYRVRCRSLLEAGRVHNLFIKEEGTVELIRSELGEGDVACDIGANMGLHTLLAAGRVGASGCVYAFEPVAHNFVSLLDSVVRNGLADRVVPLSLALTDVPGVFPFHYRSLESAASGSQLHEAVSDQEEQFEPAVSELKYGASLDSLIADGVVRAPDFIKIDVDGNEHRILRGMEQLLTGSKRPRVLSVEVNVRGRDEMFAFMERCGFKLADRNYSLAGKKLIARGEDPEAIPHNAIFRS
jgi:FkbM family methyltransferase